MPKYVIYMCNAGYSNKSNSTVDINYDHLNEKKETIYSEFGITKESATIPCIWQKFKHKWGVRKFYTEEKRRHHLCPVWRLLARGC